MTNERGFCDVVHANARRPSIAQNPPSCEETHVDLVFLIATQHKRVVVPIDPNAETDMTAAASPPHYHHTAVQWPAQPNPPIQIGPRRFVPGAQDTDRLQAGTDKSRTPRGFIIANSAPPDVLPPSKHLRRMLISTDFPHTDMSPCFGQPGRRVHDSSPTFR